MDVGADFADMGNGYQERVCQALFQDRRFADQMSDVLDPKYFTLEHLKLMSSKLFDYMRKYHDHPSMDVIEMQIQQDETIAARLVVETQVRSFVKAAKEKPLNGDMKWVQENSLEFCQRQALVHALMDATDKIESKDYGSIARIMKEALNKGAPRDAGHEYELGIDRRAKRSIRSPISTGWKPMDAVTGGGWERQTLSTVIAPTGAGKSMFLVNIACAALEQGLNVLYVTLEMADWKIALRADSYFSGVPINDVPDNTDAVRKSIGARCKGRFIVKEWPVKTATVQTIRAHIQKLEQTKEFKPDVVLVDYADLLRSAKGYGEKRHELEGNYEELRGLAQELNVVMVTADQTNRGGMNEELVTLTAIAESYAKATVCDLILTVSRTVTDKENGTGRLFIAKSRLGEDGIVFPFNFRPATVRVEVLERGTNPLTQALQNPDGVRQILADRFNKMSGSAAPLAASK